MDKKLMLQGTKNPIKPFWSWNDRLDKAELTSQIESMKKAGIGGFFMHARGGLLTEYMSDEWFADIEACLDKAKQEGLDAWAYDENGWPSGFANGAVPKMGEDYQQKKLVMAKYGDAKMPQRILASYKKADNGFIRIEIPQEDSIIIGYNINNYYIDTFNEDAIKAFINATHQKYYDRFGSRFGKDLKGFFTDEPQYGANTCIPWSQVMPEKFKSIYHYDLLDILPYLYYDTGDYKAYRADFYNFVSLQFRTSFIKQMYDWCNEHNCKLTGHLMHEHSLGAQMASTAGVMSCYEYFHEPGIDWLRRMISSPLIPKQLGSVASQLGKKTLTETFALCGWDISLNELKWIAQWQMVNGVTSLCPHLEGYSMKGSRKRDYPASLFTQLPWFEDAYPKFSLYFSRLGALLDSGTEDARVLVIHKLQSAYISYNPKNTDELTAMNASFIKAVQELNDYHIPHHYGDEVIMSHHGSIRGKELIIGKCRYNTVYLPELSNITANTLKLLEEFASAGGKIIYSGDFPQTVDGRKSEALSKLRKSCLAVSGASELRKSLSSDDLISVSSNGAEKPNIHLMHRYLDDGRELLYLVNLTNEDKKCDIIVNGRYNIYESPVTDESLERVKCTYNDGKTAVCACFAPYGSFVYILEKTDEISEYEKEMPCEKIALDNNFDIEKSDDNAITLDYCEYRVDGGEWQGSCPLIVLQKRLIDLKRRCNIEMRFKFNIEYKDFERMNLCIESPELYTFEINGKPFIFNDKGYFIDRSIRCCSIKDYVKSGKNTITVKGLFYQNENVYRVLFTPGIHEVEKNKLTYDTEIESIYITGDFGVSMKGDFRYGERRCIHGTKDFSIVKMPEKIDISKITESGFWFFSGKIKLSQEISIEKHENTNYYISLSKLNAPAAKLFINGKYAGLFGFAPFRIDITELLMDGKNQITLEMLSGNRNLLGPHHKPCGESYSVGPETFTDKAGWADDPDMPTWTDDYSFVLFGAEI